MEFDSGGVDQQLGPDPALDAVLPPDPGGERCQPATEAGEVAEQTLDVVAQREQLLTEGAPQRLQGVQPMRTLTPVSEALRRFLLGWGHQLMVVSPTQVMQPIDVVLRVTEQIALPIHWRNRVVRQTNRAGMYR